MEPDRFATHFCDIEKIPHKTKFKQSYIMYKPYGLEGQNQDKLSKGLRGLGLNLPADQMASLRRVGSKALESIVHLGFIEDKNPPKKTGKAPVPGVRRSADSRVMQSAIQINTPEYEAAAQALLEKRFARRKHEAVSSSHKMQEVLRGPKDSDAAGNNKYSRPHQPRPTREVARAKVNQFLVERYGGHPKAIRQLYMQLPRSAEGFVTREDLSKGLRRLGVAVNDAEVEALLERQPLAALPTTENVAATPSAEGGKGTTAVSGGQRYYSTARMAELSTSPARRNSGKGAAESPTFSPMKGRRGNARVTLSELKDIINGSPNPHATGEPGKGAAAGAEAEARRVPVAWSGRDPLHGGEAAAGGRVFGHELDHKLYHSGKQGQAAAASQRKKSLKRKIVDASCQSVRDSLTEKGFLSRAAFLKFDRDRDGILTRKEVEAGLRRLGVHLPDKELRHVLDRLDNRGTGVVDYPNFCRVLFPPDTAKTHRAYPTQQVATEAAAAPHEISFDLPMAPGAELLEEDTAFTGLRNAQRGQQGLERHRPEPLKSILKAKQREEEAEEEKRHAGGDADGMVNFAASPVKASSAAAAAGHNKTESNAEDAAKRILFAAAEPQGNGNRRGSIGSSDDGISERNSDDNVDLSGFAQTKLTPKARRHYHYHQGAPHLIAGAATPLTTDYVAGTAGEDLAEAAAVMGQRRRELGELRVEARRDKQKFHEVMEKALSRCNSARELFLSMNTDRDGRVDLSELQGRLQGLGSGIGQEDTAAVVRHLQRVYTVFTKRSDALSLGIPYDMFARALKEDHVPLAADRAAASSSFRVFGGSPLPAAGPGGGDSTASWQRAVEEELGVLRPQSLLSPSIRAHRYVPPRSVAEEGGDGKGDVDPSIGVNGIPRHTQDSSAVAESLRYDTAAPAEDVTEVARHSRVAAALLSKGSARELYLSLPRDANGKVRVASLADGFRSLGVPLAAADVEAFVRPLARRQGNDGGVEGSSSGEGATEAQEGSGGPAGAGYLNINEFQRLLQPRAASHGAYAGSYAAADAKAGSGSKGKTLHHDATNERGILTSVSDMQSRTAAPVINSEVQHVAASAGRTAAAGFLHAPREQSLEEERELPTAGMKPAGVVPHRPVRRGRANPADGYNSGDRMRHILHPDPQHQLPPSQLYETAVGRGWGGRSEGRSSSVPRLRRGTDRSAPHTMEAAATAAAEPQQRSQSVPRQRGYAANEPRPAGLTSTDKAIIRPKIFGFASRRHFNHTSQVADLFARPEYPNSSASP